MCVSVKTPVSSQLLYYQYIQISVSLTLDIPALPLTMLSKQYAVQHFQNNISTVS